MNDYIASTLFRENETMLSAINFITEDIQPCENIDIITREFNTSMVKLNEAMIKIDKYELENANTMTAVEYKVFTEKSFQEIKEYFITKAKEFWEKLKVWFNTAKNFMARQMEKVEAVIRFIFNLDQNQKDLDFDLIGMSKKAGVILSIKWFPNDSRIEQMMQANVEYINNVVDFTEDSINKFSDNPTEEEICKFYKLIPNYIEFLQNKFIRIYDPKEQTDLKGSVFFSSAKKLDEAGKWFRNLTRKLHPDITCARVANAFNNIKNNKNLSSDFITKAERIHSIYSKHFKEMTESAFKMVIQLNALLKAAIELFKKYISKYGNEIYDKINDGQNKEGNKESTTESVLYQIETDSIIKEYYDEFNSLFVNEALALPANIDHSKDKTASNNTTDTNDTEDKSDGFFAKAKEKLGNLKDNIVKFFKWLSEKISILFDKVVKFLKEKWKQFKDFLTRMKLFITYNSSNPKANEKIEIKVFGDDFHKAYNDFRAYFDNKVIEPKNIDIMIQTFVGASLVSASGFNKIVKKDKDTQKDVESINTASKEYQTVQQMYNEVKFNDIVKKTMTVDQAMKLIREHIKYFEEHEKTIRNTRNHCDRFILILKKRAEMNLEDNKDFANFQISCGKILRMISLRLHLEVQRATTEYALARENSMRVARLIRGEKIEDEEDVKKESYINDLLQQERRNLMNEAAVVIRSINEEVEEVMDAAIEDNNAQGIERISKAKMDSGSVTGDPDKLTYDKNCYSQTNKIGTENIAGTIGLDAGTDTKTTISMGNPTKAVEELAFEYFSRDFI